jgi:hypothetical protein
MIRKFFIFFLIAFIGFTLSFSITGCKKNKTKDSAVTEENEDDEDDSEDGSEDSE